eukprot:GEMP01008915.1.p1 GENE.GEMP01008915.1~~GEMP01008915.1.p1  ORF type:complete len:960 (+),score=182.31 GEMP01008915.1:144-3023(+)
MIQAHACPHLADVSYDAIIQWFTTPEFKKAVTSRTQKCDKCWLSENLWACFGDSEECQFIGCGENAKAHAQRHSEEKGHPLCIGIDSKMLWCNKCVAEIQDELFDEFDASIESLTRYDRVKAVRASLQDVWCMTPSPVFVDEKARIGARELSKPRRGLVGLVNLGNTCYMSAALQCLSHTYAFQKYFRRCVDEIPISQKDNVWGARLVSGARQWVEKTWGDCISVDAHSPEEILRAVQHHSPSFQGYQQHDSQEFLRALLDCLHEEMKSKVPAFPMAYLNKTYPSDSVRLEEHVMRAPKKRKNKAGEDVKGKKRDRKDKAAKKKQPETPPTPSRSSEEVEQVSVQDGNSLLEGEEAPQAKKQDEEEEDEEQMDTEDPADRVKLWSPISDIFAAQSVSIIRCCVCQEISKTVEISYDISVAIPTNQDVLELRNKAQLAHEANSREQGRLKNCPTVFPRPGSGIFGRVSGTVRNLFSDQKQIVTLTDCLRKYCETETLSGKDKYECDKCKTKVNCKKTILFHDVPQVLCIHLKRFKHDGNMAMGSKTSKHVAFPLENFDLSEFTDVDHSIDPGIEPKPCEYRLCGLIEHTGSLSGGHYIAFCRHRKRPDEWYEYDDATVTQVSAERVEQAEAYILFYQLEASIDVTRRRETAKQDVAETKEKIQKKAAEGDSNLSDLSVCYVPLTWFVRFQTMSRAGPIDNFLHRCPHSFVTVIDKEIAVKRFIPMSVAMYEEMTKTYGGGPRIRTLEPCERCIRHVAAYNQRKQMEFDLVSKYDANQAYESCWIMLDFLWVDKWKKYVRAEPVNDVDHLILLGNIDNSRLMQDGEFKPNLQLKVDYIAVNYRVWCIFKHIHGCVGAPICRELVDIYSPEADVAGTPPFELSQDAGLKCSWLFVDACKGDKEVLTRLADTHEEVRCMLNLPPKSTSHAGKKSGFGEMGEAVEDEANENAVANVVVEVVDAT